MLCHLLGIHCNAHWYNFGYASYKFMTTVFEVYCRADPKIWEVCGDYLTMPKDVVSVSSHQTPPRKKRTRNTFELATPDNQTPEVDVICLITESEESGAEGAAPSTPVNTPTKTPSKTKTPTNNTSPPSKRKAPTTNTSPPDKRSSPDRNS